MNANREDKSLIFPVCEIKLLSPQSLHHMCVHKSLRPGSSWYGLKRWPIVNVPVRRYLHDLGRLDASHRFHPAGRPFGVVCFDPGMGIVRRKIGLNIMVHKRMIVYDSCSLELWDESARGCPSGCGVSFWSFAVAELGQGIDRFVEDSLLFSIRKLTDVLVRVAMQTELVARIAHFGQLLGEGFQGMRRREEAGFDGELVKEVKESIHPDCCAIDSTRDVGGILRCAVGCVQPILDSRQAVISI